MFLNNKIRLQINHYRRQSSPKRGKEALVTVPNNKNCNQAQTHFQVLTKPKIWMALL